MTKHQNEIMYNFNIGYYLVLALVFLLLMFQLNDAHSKVEEEGFFFDFSLNAIQDSNIYRSNTKVDDLLTTLNSSVRYKELYGKYSFNASYSNKYSAHKDISSLDHVDQIVGVGAAIKHNSKITSDYSLLFSSEIEPLGSNNAINTIIDEYNQIEKSEAKIGITYGGSNSMGQILLDADRSDFKYKNNNQEFRDRNESNIALTFLYRLGNKTRLILEAEYRYLDYDVTDFNPSNTQYSFLTGLQWRPSQALRTSIKLGYREVDFKNRLFNGNSGLSYDIELEWLPNSFTEFSLVASRVVNENAEISGFGYLSDQVKLTINHYLTERLVVNSELSFATSDITSNEPRTEDVNSFRAFLEYAGTKSVTYKLGIIYNKRSAEIAIYNYQALQINAGINYKF